MKRNQIAHQKKYFDKEFGGIEKYALDSWRLSYQKRIFSSLFPEEKHGKKNLKYLDIGCGGMAYLPIEAAKLGVMAYGLDLSSQAITKAREFASNQGVTDRTRFVRGNAEILPFKDDFFDCVSCIAVLEHLINDEKAVCEIARVCKSGAKVFITVPNAYRFMPFYTWLPYLIHDKRIGHLRHYRASNLKRLFENQGFETEKIFFSGHHIKFVQLAFSKIAHDDKLWWKLENIDLNQKSACAVTLNAIFKK